jgi:hypothetical protein
MKKEKIWTLIIIGIILVISIGYLLMPKGSTTADIAKCIGQKSVLYTQLGCHYCATQEEMFGDAYKELTIVDCFYNQKECLAKDIKGTPTWEINGKMIVGVQSIKNLQDLTGC